MTDPRTVIDRILNDIRVRASGRTHYQGSVPQEDELLAAEIQRLRAIVLAYALRANPKLTPAEYEEIIHA